MAASSASLPLRFTRQTTPRPCSGSSSSAVLAPSTWPSLKSEREKPSSTTPQPAM
jgi:hypothetical protein